MAHRRNTASLTALLLLSACGGGGAGTDTVATVIEEPAIIIFHDEFDAPEDQWTLSDGPSDPDAPPSALGLGETEATPSHHVFHRDGGALEFVVSMAWPGDCAATAPPRSRPIQLVERVSDLVIASLVVEPVPGCDDVRIDYRVDPTGTVTSSSVVGQETWPLDAFADAFHDYVLILHEDGRARWMRDGRVLITAFVPLADQELVLRLGGRAGPGAPVLYDSVEVRRP